MRPIFVGNFGYDTRQSELERLFAKYGRVERIDMKSGILQFLCTSLHAIFNEVIINLVITRVDFIV